MAVAFWRMSLRCFFRRSLAGTTDSSIESTGLSSFASASASGDRTSDALIVSSIDAMPGDGAFVTSRTSATESITVAAQAVGRVQAINFE
jgi:hypothetical protein